MSDTPLAPILHARIRDEGPMNVAEWMATCLGHPRHGYYTTREPFGPAGDFTTAPEVSQMFGELIGLWAARAWLDAGGPAPLRLVEIGPGRGTLMRDVARATARVPGFAARTIHLIETSPRLRAVQARTLAQVPGVDWADSLGDVAPGWTILLANELFDALPISQHVFSRGAWHERLVGSDGETFGFGLAAEPRALDGLPPDPREGDVWEGAPAREALATAIGRRVAAGGAALLVDYGHLRSAYGDTLQAVRDHAYAPVLEAPGQADLTSHVDFERLAGAAAMGGAVPLAPVAQGALLRALGLDARAEALARANPARAGDLARDRDRLAAPDQMGALFKALALKAPGAPTPPAFTETASR